MFRVASAIVPNRENADWLANNGLIDKPTEVLTPAQIGSRKELDYEGIGCTHQAMKLRSYCYQVERLPRLKTLIDRSERGMNLKLSLFIAEVYQNPVSRFKEGKTYVLYFTANGFEIAKEQYGTNRNGLEYSIPARERFLGFSISRLPFSVFDLFTRSGVTPDDILINLGMQVYCVAHNNREAQLIKDELLQHRRIFNQPKR